MHEAHVVLKIEACVRLLSVSCAGLRFENTLIDNVGHGHSGTLVESKPFDRRVVGSNLALIAT